MSGPGDADLPPDPPPATASEQRILLAEEVLRVDRHTVQTGRVVVRTTVREHDETVNELLRTERVDVERVPVGRPVDTAPGVREEADGTLVVPVLEEVLVVEKRLILREEIRIRRTGGTRAHRETVRLRREEATVERRAPDGFVVNQPAGNQKDE